MLGEVASVVGRDLQVEGLSFSTQWSGPDRARLELGVKSASLPGPVGDIADVTLICPDLVFSGDEIQCRDGRMRMTHPLLSGQPFGFSFVYSASRGLTMDVSGLDLAGGATSGTAHWIDGKWDLRLRARRLDLSRAGTVMIPAQVKAFTPSGRLDIDLQVQGSAAGVDHLTAELQASAVGFADPTDRHVGQGLAGRIHLGARRHRLGWDLSGKTTIRAGQLYLDPLFLDLGANPLEMELKGRWRPATGALVLDRVRLNHQGIVAAVAEGRIPLGHSPDIPDLELRLSKVRMPGFYTTYLQPLLIGTSVDDLDVVGGADAVVRIGEEGTGVNARLRGVGFEDRQGRFGMQGLSADLKWHDEGSPLLSPVSFERAHVYGLELGGAHLSLASSGRALSLVQPVTIPVFDGELRLNELYFDALGTAQLAWRLDALLTPVSMASFTEAVGLPRMSGRLSGVIPEVRYRAGVMRVGGAILIRVFDGDVVVSDLRLEAPFGTVPRLTTDIAIRDLDLHALTQRFAFGKIKGRVTGWVRNLELVDWEPVQFDLFVATPENDRSRHRISQRAVDSISSLGGGVPGAVSRSFLRVFKSFSYGKLGLSCRLRNQVCLMDGIAPARGSGYYLVKGAGLPRIDVIGHVREVDWDELVRRLRAVTRARGSLEPKGQESGAGGTED